MKGNSFLKFAIPMSGLMLVILIIMSSVSPIACTTTQIQLAPYSIEDFGPYIAAQTVMVRAGTSSGSGTLINKQYVLTAYHVVQGSSEALIDLPGASGIRCSVETFGNLESVDYAILKIEDEIPEGIELNIAQVDLEEEFLVGRQIFFAGFPQGGDFHLTEGLLSSISDTFYKTSAPVMFGQSGGGVYDNHGHLIGVISRMGQMNNGFFSIPIYHDSYYVPIQSIFKDLSMKNKTYVFQGFEK